MDPRLGDLLREVEMGAGHFAETPRVAREAGQFLNMLAKSARARNLLEIGTQAGYATLWLAEAAAATGGRVTSIEGDVWQAENAKHVLERSPHAERIQFFHGELTDIAAMLEGPFDFVLLDVDPAAVMPTFRLIIEQVSSGALICCNKAIAHAAALVEYLSYVHERPGLQSVLVPIGEGIELTYRVP
jgi:predicted O-methyltransferase YrrM